MKQLLLACFLCITGMGVSAQPVPPPDQSPMDISYYPPNYPLLKTQEKITDAPVARVIYSRPARNERQIFGGLVERNCFPASVIRRVDWRVASTNPAFLR